jgi:membrane protein implicated in regulation of membrane protease activity
MYLLVFRGRLQRQFDRGAGSVDTLIGELSVPRERIEPGAVGRTDLRGSLWNARNESSSPVEPGQRCRVTRVEGLLVYIQPE